MDINQFFTTLDALFANKDMQQAETYMQESLVAAEQTSDLGSAIAICSELGGYYRMLSRYTEGIALYEKAISYLQQLGLLETEHHATTLMNYATTCTLTGETEKALSLYTKAGEIFMQKGLTQDYRMATLYNNMSSLYQDLGDYDKAEEHLSLALCILEQLREAEIETAITYTNWAQLCFSKGRVDDAEEKINRAIALFESAGGDSDVHYAAALNVSGEIAFAKEDFTSALQQFERAMALTARDFGSNTQSYAILCDNAARCCSKLGDSAASAQYTEKAASIRERIAK